MLLFYFLFFFFFLFLNHKVPYNQWMKLVSSERAAISGMKHGSMLIMHSSSSEHFRTGGEGDGARLQIRGKPPIHIRALPSAPGYPQARTSALAVHQHLPRGTAGLWSLGTCPSQSQFSRCHHSSAGWSSDIEGLKYALLGERLWNCISGYDWRAAAVGRCNFRAGFI